ncbi:MAG: DinB family protein [Gemmatimonadales bacterium]|jgi:hypothetical protein
METETDWLLRLLDEAFDGPAWHGPTLSQAVRGFSAEQAAWRPAPGRRSAWEIVLHCAYWEHRVHERVAPGTALAFPRAGSNWPRLPEKLSAARWRADVSLLKSVHAGLREAVASLPAASLQRPAPGQKKTRLANIIGVCCHDIYHAGQIRLLQRIQGSEPAGRRRLTPVTRTTHTHRASKRKPQTSGRRRGARPRPAPGGRTNLGKTGVES